MRLVTVKMHDSQGQRTCEGGVTLTSASIRSRSASLHVLSGEKSRWCCRTSPAAVLMLLACENQTTCRA